MNFRNLVRWGLIAAGLLFVYAQSSALSPVLKFRVLLEEPQQLDDPASRDVDIRILNDENAGSASLKANESASTLEQIRQRLVESDYVRVVEQGGDLAGADLVLRYRVNYKETIPVVFVSLLNPNSMAVVYSLSEQGPNVESALDKIIPALEESLLERNWTVRVKVSANGKILVPRGENDGLLEGLVLIGYSTSTIDTVLAIDELLLLAGDPAGSYQVVQVRDEGALLEPVEESPILEPGDLLEYAGVDFAKKEIPDRKRDVWKRLYNKDNESN